MLQHESGHGVKQGYSIYQLKLLFSVFAEIRINAHGLVKPDARTQKTLFLYNLQVNQKGYFLLSGETHTK